MKSAKVTNTLLLIVAVILIGIFFQLGALRSPAYAPYESLPVPEFRPLAITPGETQPGFLAGPSQIVIHLYAGDLPKDIRESLWKRFRPQQ